MVQIVVNLFEFIKIKTDFGSVIAVRLLSLMVTPIVVTT